MGIYQVPIRLAYSGPGSPGVNVWHVRTVSSTSVGVTTELNLALTAIKNFYAANASIYPSNCSQNFDGEVVSVATSSPERATATAWTISGGGGTVLTSQLLCLVVSWRTTSATRSGTGRTFLGPLADATVGGDGLPVASRITTLRTSATALVDASKAGNGWAVGVFSRSQNIFRDATSAAVKDKFAFLASRRD